MHRPARSALYLLVLGASATLCRAQAPQASPGSQWLSYNNHLDGQRFSPLEQITPANIAKLGEVCRVKIDGPTSFHADLVVVDGVIYTDTGRETVALDATTCAVRWRYSYVPQEDRSSPSNRGVAVMDGRVFRGTGDDRLLALDAATGKVLWTDIIGAPRLGESAAAAPLAWNGVIYMGIAGSELGVRGRVMAFDAATGRELWRFNTIPMGNETGADTWKKAGTAKTGGGGVWGAMSVDPATDELFVSVGNPWPDIDTAYRPGTNLFTDSLVVLDAHSGALKWWHQLAPSDWNDLDLVAAAVLYREAGARDYVAIAGKDGYVTALDRDTHQVIFHTPVTTIGPPLTAATPQGVNSCPGYAGGVEWNGPALDTLNNTLVVGSVDACFVVKLSKTGTVYTPGGANFGGTVQPTGPTSGWVTSMDSRTGVIRWKYHAQKPVVAGVTPTAGDVTFTGDLAGNLLIFNSKTGELLRKIQTGGAMAGGVVTYEARGRQYLAFASGNVSRNAFGDLGVPTVVIMSLNPGAVRVASAGAGPEHAAGGRAARLADGRRLYSQVCVSCHGPDGNMIADHKLSTLAGRRDHAGTESFIENPQAPMPKLYPDLITRQEVSDVTAYLYHDIVK